MTAAERVPRAFSDNIDTIMRAAESLPSLICDAADMISGVLVNDGKILICGNGTAASDALDLASKLLNRFEKERPSLPAIALPADAVTITSVSRDNGYNEVFARQIRALGNSGDLLLLFSADGKSSSLIQAVQAARLREMKIIALSGSDGGDLARLLQHGDVEIRVPSGKIPRVQEVHRLILHCLCDLIDHNLFNIQE